jgi:hypothetical protein
MSKSAESSIERGALWATVANPAPAKSVSKQRKKGSMAIKKRRKKKATRKHPRAHRHATHRAHRSNPEEMVLVPASIVQTTTNPGPKRKKRHPHAKRRHHHHPHKRNPASDGEHSHIKDAVAAVGFGALAAVAGLAGGFALSKAGLQSKAANVAANVAAGAAIGGALGMFDRAAGIVVAHNYAVAAGQWLASSPAGQSTQTRNPNAVAMGAGVAPKQLKAKALHGPDDMEGYEKLQGVVADSMGSPDDVDGFEKLEGVVADSMGEATDVEGFEKLEGVVADDMGDGGDVEGFEKLEGVVADDMGEADELGEEEFGEADEMGDGEDVGEPEMFD